MPKSICQNLEGEIPASLVPRVLNRAWTVAMNWKYIHIFALPSLYQIHFVTSSKIFPYVDRLQNATVMIEDKIKLNKIGFYFLTFFRCNLWLFSSSIIRFIKSLCTHHREIFRNSRPLSVCFSCLLTKMKIRFVYIFHITPNFASNQLTLSSCLLYLRNQYQGILSKSEITKNQNKGISTIKA